MSTTATVLVALAGVAALVDWWGVARGRLGVEFIAKPLVIIGLIGAALAVDTGDGVVRGLVVAALGASLVGDVVLMTPDARFEAGVFAFLVAHVLYITAFLETGGLDVGAGVAAAVLIIGIGFGAVPQIIAGARLRGPAMQTGVTVSLAVIAVTALLAAATGALTAMIAGALLLASDALLGWNRFVDRAPGGRVLVQVTNHAAHVGFVLWLTS
ncbi:MAG: lysoplasmalogenase family protein [Acidimicrobiales bacterium]